MLPNQALKDMHSDDTGLNLGQASFPLVLEYFRVLDSPLSHPLARIPGMTRGSDMCSQTFGKKSRIHQSALFFQMFDVRKTRTNRPDQPGKMLLKK